MKPTIANTTNLRTRRPPSSFWPLITSTKCNSSSLGVRCQASSYRPNRCIRTYYCVLRVSGGPGNPVQRVVAIGGLYRPHDQDRTVGMTDDEIGNVAH